MTARLAIAAITLLWACTAWPGNLLELRNGRFDPAVESLTTLPAIERALEEAPALPVSAGSAWIVQFERSLRDADHRLLLEHGATLRGYLPQHALLITLHGAQRPELASAPGVRLVHRYEPAMKLDPRLADPALPAADGIPDLEAILFEGEAATTLARDLDATFGERATTAHAIRHDGGGTLLVEVRPEDRLQVAAALARHPAVRDVVYRAPVRPNADHAVWISQSYDRSEGPLEAEEAVPRPYADSAPVWNRGLLGEGQIIAIADTQLEFQTCYWEDPGHPVTPQQVAPPGPLAVDLSHRKVVAVNGVLPTSLGTFDAFRHGTHVAAVAAGDRIDHPAAPGFPGHDEDDGMAPLARILFQDISISAGSNCTGSVFTPSIEALLDQSHAAGARVVNNSWGGGSGVYGASARGVDSAVWRQPELVAVFSAGNGGAGGVNDQAACKNCLAVGAAESYEPERDLDPENMAAFSSRGPAADGRIKPDVVAPGDRVFSNRFTTRYIADENDPECQSGGETCFPSFGGCYLTDTVDTCVSGPLRGTSHAAPIVAGQAALVREYFERGFYPSGSADGGAARVPSAALVRAMLIHGGRNLTGTVEGAPVGDAPNSVQGWGRTTLGDVLRFEVAAGDLRIEDRDDAGGLATGGSFSIGIDVAGAAEPLRVTLTWTDPPGETAASRALVNDLDLTVEAPDGTLYRGNQWSDDPGIVGDLQSLTDAPGRDTLNNVEGVRIAIPEAGTYTVRVDGADVPGYQGVSTQGFALVVTAQRTPAGGGGAGEVPDGAAVPGVPLTVTREAGGDLTLSWSASCTGDADYGVYEGTLGDFTSHAPRQCTTAGALSTTLSPSAGDRYYLVVPQGPVGEGGYGRDDAGALRPPALAPCLPQNVEACP